MNIKIRKENQDGIVKIETSGNVKEIMINKDILHPEGESIAVCFRGKSSSGIVEFTPGEIERLYRSVKSRLHLIKGIKKI